MLVLAWRNIWRHRSRSIGAAFAVGYESVQQFTREYRRLFGRPPGRDAEALRSEVSAAA